MGFGLPWGRPVRQGRDTAKNRLPTSRSNYQKRHDLRRTPVLARLNVHDVGFGEYEDGRTPGLPSGSWVIRWGHKDGSHG